MSSPKKNDRHPSEVVKLAPNAKGARDMGPRLIPLQNETLTDRQSSKKFLELANVALGKKKKAAPSATHARKKRSA